MFARDKLWSFVQKEGRLVFRTREISSLLQISLSSASQLLRRLSERNVVQKVLNGVWAFTNEKKFDPLMLVPYLNANGHNYVSFITALHMYGVISQIPQKITVASTSHSRVVKTPVAVFEIHQIDPAFFDGFEWNKSFGYLIAKPEKAFVDCLYIASRKGKKYANFPELDFSTGFDFKKTLSWANKIKDAKIRKSVLNKLDKFRKA